MKDVSASRCWLIPNPRIRLHANTAGCRNLSGLGSSRQDRDRLLEQVGWVEMSMLVFSSTSISGWSGLKSRRVKPSRGITGPTPNTREDKEAQRNQDEYPGRAALTLHEAALTLAILGGNSGSAMPCRY
jgi:hypothetical protein